MKNQASSEDQTFIVKFLNEELVRRKRLNSQYSMRSFANFLEMDNSTLSKILNSKRAVGTKLAIKILKKFHLNEDKIEEIIKFQKMEGDEFVPLSSEAYSMISDWYYYGILELIRLDEFIGNTAWIADRLNIPIDQASEAIKRLIEYKFIEIDDQGKWIDLTGGNTTHLEKGSTTGAKRNHQKEIMKMGIEAIDYVPIEKRSHTSLTFAVDTEKIDEAKDLITKFRRDMAKLLSDGKKRDEVYHLGIQLYPITNNISGENNEKIN